MQYQGFLLAAFPLLCEGEGCWFLCCKMLAGVVSELGVKVCTSNNLHYSRKAIILYRNTYLDSVTVVIQPCKLIYKRTDNRIMKETVN